MNKICARCLDVYEVSAEQSHQNAQYCEFCCPNGTLEYPGDDIHAFRHRLFAKLHAEGVNEFVARFRTLLIGSAPYWKNRR